MANDITRQGAAVKPQRDIETVTAEIKDICAQARRMMLIYAIEVGRRLVEAKEILPHGEWGDWLKNEVEFSQDTANNHMKLYHAYGSTQYTLFGADLNSETFRNLSYSAALKLLAVPDDEREDFVKDNDIENKSVREIDRLIKERDEAKKCAEGLKSGIDDLRTRLEEAEEESERLNSQLNAATSDRDKYISEIGVLEDKLVKSKDAEKKAKAKLKDLKANPEIPKEKIDELRADIEKQAADANAAEIEKQLADIRKKLAAAEEAEIKAKREAENAAGRVAELEKQVKIADPAVGEFRLLFKHVQDYIFELKTALEKIKDKPTADKLRGAMKALAAELEVN